MIPELKVKSPADWSEAAYFYIFNNILRTKSNMTKADKAKLEKEIMSRYHRKRERDEARLVFQGILNEKVKKDM